MTHNNTAPPATGLELVTNDTLPVSRSRETLPFADASHVCPRTNPPDTPPLTGPRTLTHTSLEKRRRSPVGQMLAGSFWILKAWQMDLQSPPAMKPWLDQRLTDRLVEQFAASVDLDAVHIEFTTDRDPAVANNGDEYFELRLSLRQIVQAMATPSTFLALRRCVVDRLVDERLPGLTASGLFRLLINANWSGQYETMLREFWRRHADTWKMLARISFLEGIESLRTRRRISRDGYRIGLDALGLTSFPENLQALHGQGAPRRSVLHGLMLDDEVIPGILHLKSKAGHCFVHILGDPAYCIEYICDDAAWNRDRVMDALNESLWHRLHLNLDQPLRGLTLGEPLKDPFEHLARAQQQFSLGRLEDADFAELPDDITVDESDVVHGPIWPALAMISAQDHWHDEARLHERMPTLLTTANRLMGKWLKDQSGLATRPEHVFLRYLPGTSIRPWGTPTTPINQVIVPDEQPIALGQALIENYRVQHPVGYNDHGGRWVVYADTGGQGIWSPEKELPVSVASLEDQIRRVDFLAVMTDQLKNFWGQQSVAIERRLTSTLVAQALFSLKRGSISATGFDLLALALQQDHERGYDRDTCWSALGFYLPGTSMFAAQAVICPGLLVLRQGNRPDFLLYQAGQQQPFVEFESRQQLVDHISRASSDEHWRRTLLNYIPIRFQSSLEYILELWGGVRRPPEPVSRLRPWTDRIYNEAVHKAMGREMSEQAIAESPARFLAGCLRNNSLDDADDGVVTDRERVIDYWTGQINRLQLLLAPMTFFLPAAAIAMLTASAASLALDIQAAKLPGYRESERRQVMIAVLTLGLLHLAPATPRLLRALSRFSTPGNLVTVTRTTAPLRNFGVWLQRATDSRRTVLDTFFNGAGPLKNWRVTGNGAFGTQPVRVWKLGRKFLLWTSQNNQARTLVVSSHGYYLPWTRAVAVPNGTELRIYAPHGSELLDPGLHKVVSQSIKPYALLNSVQARPGPGIGPFQNLNEGNRLMAGTALPGHIKNYSLSKFQSDTYESYRDISDIVRNAHQSSLPSSIPASPTDVLTVRNRFGMRTPTLQDMFTELHHQGIHYDRILLVHCRCSAIRSMLGRSPAYDAPQGLAPITP